MIKRGSGQLYHKLFFIYTAIIIVIVFSLTFYFFTSTKNRILNTNLEYMELLSDKALSYLEDSLDTANAINNELYQSQHILQDVLHYLNDDSETYLRYRLDNFMLSPSFQYTGIDSFAEKTFDSYPTISKINFISYKQEKVTTYYSSGGNHSQSFDNSFLPSIMDGTFDEYGTFSFSKELRNPSTMSSEGCMVITFNTKKLTQIKKTIPLPQIILLHHTGQMLYSSSLSGETEVVYYNKLETEDLSASYVTKEALKDYILLTHIPRSQAAKIPASVLLTISVIGIGLTLLGILCVHFYLQRLSSRLSHLLEGMNQITTGDLSVRLQSSGGGDELDLISSHFNDMCEKLDRYIQKSYLAEIEQKNAEIEVLQNQINPHFLYNTLEAIRMKAICNGDREVGKMLYSMAVIFRSQLKDNDIITLIQEIHYCKKYLELFEYRYPEKFSFEINYPEELMDVPIIKFILQPILENYFIHGIRSEQEGNFLSIDIEKKDSYILMHVCDNGQGMSVEQLLVKNSELTQNDTSTRKSIGLSNVNRRLKAFYGSDYGITLAHSKSGGLHVILKAGLGGITDEKNNAD